MNTSTGVKVGVMAVLLIVLSITLFQMDWTNRSRVVESPAEVDLMPEPQIDGPTLLSNGDSFAFSDDVTVTVAWVDRGEYLEVQTIVANGSDQVVSGVTTNVSLTDGTSLELNPHKPNEWIEDVLPGKTATSVESYWPVTGELQAKVYWLFRDEMRDSGFTHWTGQV